MALCLQTVLFTSLIMNLGKATEIYHMKGFVKRINTKTLVGNEDGKSTMVRSLLECAGVCVRKPLCVGYWFLSSENRCYVGPRLVTENHLIGGRETNHYTIKGIYKLLTSPETSLTRVSYHADFTCHRSHVTCRDTTARTCPQSGKWNSLSIPCKQCKWTKPMNDIIYTMLWCKRGKFRIQLVGTPTQKEELSFRLMRDTDILLLVSVRFNQHGYRRKVLFQSKLAGTWGKYSRCRKFPFWIGKTFRIIITLSRGHYKMSVDGRRMRSFREELPGAKPDRYEIKGGVVMESVTVST